MTLNSTNTRRGGGTIPASRFFFLSRRGIRGGEAGHVPLADEGLEELRLRHAADHFGVVDEPLLELLQDQCLIFLEGLELSHGSTP
jgi:hypothetical protein